MIKIYDAAFNGSVGVTCNPVDETIDLMARSTTAALNGKVFHVDVRDVNSFYISSSEVAQQVISVNSAIPATYLSGVANMGIWDDPVAIIADSANRGSGCNDSAWNVRGEREYELVNHLGNVVTVVSDRKEAVGSAGVVSYWKAKVLSATDYWPFGQPLAGRQYEANRYRYGFNGKENDNEWNGVVGGTVDFGARIYDSRLGRFMSIDPRYREFAGWSPYVFALDNPIMFYDENGEGPGDGKTKVYITEVTLGNGKNVYLAKRYYENITQFQYDTYKREMKTPNGWYVVSKEEYRVFKENENAFSNKCWGADNVERENKITSKLPEYQRFQTEKNEGFLNVKAIGDGGKVNVGAYDAEGNKTILGTINVNKEEGAEAKIKYNYSKGGGLFVDKNDGVKSLEINATTLPKKGGKRFDNMDKYGKESPTKKDIKEMESQK